MMQSDLIQAYRQAPWRAQLQMIGLFCLGLVLIALVAGVYLNVTARAATVGRRVQALQVQIETARRRNADLETGLARITSVEIMEARAQALGFQPASGDSFLYVMVPGYPGRQPVVMAPPPGPLTATGPHLPPEFTQSLLDWFQQLTLRPPISLSEVLP